MKMPLKSGRSDKVIQENIRELVSAYEETGKIGNTRPRSKKDAIRIATAIAYDKAGRSRDKGKKAIDQEQIIGLAVDYLREKRRGGQKA